MCAIAKLWCLQNQTIHAAAAASFPVQYTVYCMQELDAVSLQSGKFGFKGTVKHISYSFLKGR